MTDTEYAAEEGGGGKAILIQRGGYKEMDVCLMSACYLYGFLWLTVGCLGHTQLQCRLGLQPLELAWPHKTSSSST